MRIFKVEHANNLSGQMACVAQSNLSHSPTNKDSGTGVERHLQIIYNKLPICHTVTYKKDRSKTAKLHQGLAAHNYVYTRLIKILSSIICTVTAALILQAVSLPPLPWLRNTRKALSPQQPLRHRIQSQTNAS